jgi:hypothetical protein
VRVTCVTSRYLPSLRHLVRLCEVDCAVILDLAPLPHQNRDSFVTRNRIRHRATGQTQWLSVPVLRRRGQTTRETVINPTDHRWAERHVRGIQCAYAGNDRVAPSFVAGLAQILGHADAALLEINSRTLGYLFTRLRRPKRLVHQSSLGLRHDKNHRLAVAKLLGATTYVAGPVEWHLMTASAEYAEFAAAGISVVRSPDLPVSDWDRDLVTRLSAVHAICTVGYDSARQLLDSGVKYSLESMCTVTEGATDEHPSK